MLSVYQNWAAGFPGFTDTATGSDPDNDQKSNLLEFAFGTNPTTPSSGYITYSGGVISANGQPTTSITNITNGVDYRAVFGRNLAYRPIVRRWSFPNRMSHCLWSSKPFAAECE